MSTTMLGGDSFVALAILLLGCGGTSANRSPDEPTRSDGDDEVTLEAPGSGASAHRSEGVTVEAPGSGAGNDGPSEALARYEALLEQAVAARGSDRVALYEEAIRIYPDGAEARAILAFRIFSMAPSPERTARAIELASSAVALDPTLALAWLVLGAARELDHDTPGALAAYTACIELGPRTRDVRTGLSLPPGQAFRDCATMRDALPAP